jgi:hypothetical protein
MMLAVVISSASQVRAVPNPEQQAKTESSSGIGALTLNANERAVVKTGTDEWKPQPLSSVFSKLRNLCVRPALVHVSASLLTPLAAPVSAKLQL